MKQGFLQVEVEFLGIFSTRISNHRVLQELINPLVIDPVLSRTVRHGCERCPGAVP